MMLQTVDGTSPRSALSGRTRPTWTALALLLVAATVCGDGLIFGFEGDTLPGTGTDWVIANVCEPDCSRRLDEGHFILEWGVMGDFVNYDHSIAAPPVAPPPTLWVEWRFRSNQPKPATSSSCDSRLVVAYGGFFVLARIFQDIVVAKSLGSEVQAVAPGVFHTYRLESPDGLNYTVAVDGVVFTAKFDNRRSGEISFIQFGGEGGCSVAPDRPIPVRNEWDFFRYGTISSGERIEASDPQAGFLDPNAFAGLDRFTVTYDSANYVYVDEITVETTGAEAPIVLKSQRLDNGAPDTVEIVLDRPLAPGEHTRFIFDDGTIQNTVDYSFILGDADGNGALDLRDAAGFQNCFGTPASNGACLAFDQDVSGIIDANDIAPFSTSLNGPRE